MIGAFAGGLAQGVGQGLNIYEQLQRVSEENRKRRAQEEISSYTASARQRGEKPTTFFKTLGEMYAAVDPQASATFAQMAQQQDEIEDNQFLGQAMAGATVGDPAMTAQGWNAYAQKKGLPWTASPAAGPDGTPTIAVSTQDGASTMYEPGEWAKKVRAQIAILAMGPDKGALFPEEQQNAELRNQGQGLQNQGQAIDNQFAPAINTASIQQTQANTGLIGANTQQTALETQLMPGQVAAENAARYASAASAQQNVRESQALLPYRQKALDLEAQGQGYQNEAARAGLPYVGRAAEAKIRGEEADAKKAEALAATAGQARRTPRRYGDDDYAMAGSALDRLAGGVSDDLTGGFVPSEGVTARYPSLQDPGARAEVEAAASAIGEQNDLDLTTAALVAARIDAGEYQLSPTEDPNFYAVQTESGGVIYVPAAVAEQFIDFGAVNPGVSE
jgi:predicted HicB family RNase H-like nuclease